MNKPLRRLTACRPANLLICEEEEDDVGYVFYNPLTQDKHFDAYAAALTRYGYATAAYEWHETKSE